MPINEAFGWVWIVLGFLSGAVLGAGFLREDFLGGYASERRRLVRLGHISFFGLGVLNVLFAIGSPPRVLEGALLSAASWALIVGGVLMPLCCAAVAWRRELKPVFAAPVVSLIAAGMACVWAVAS